MAKSKSGSNMNMMIGAAVVVVIIVVVAAVLLMGKSNAPQSTTPATTTAVNTTSNSTSTGTTSTNTTTTTTQPSSGTFASWQGKNLSLSTFSQDLGQSTFAKLTTANATYDYNISISEGTNNTALNGVLTQELYQNSSRTTTNLTYSNYHIQTVSIYNASSHKSYTCSGSSGSFSCFASSLNESISNGNTGINYVVNKGGTNTTVTGYFSNIQVSSSSINGQPCTLITGDLYVDSANAKGSYVLSGTMNACVSTQTNLSLRTSLVGTTALTASSGSTRSGSFNYTETWVRNGPAPTASITALLGPVSTV